MEGIDWSQLGLGGGIFGAIALVVVTLIKARSEDRKNILTQQASHMDRLGKERNEAIVDRDKAYDEAEEWRKKYEGEIRSRIEAEAQAAAANASTGALKRQVEELTQQVLNLTGEVQRLSALTEAGQGGHGV